MVRTSDIFNKIAKLLAEGREHFVLVLNGFCPMY